MFWPYLSVRHVDEQLDYMPYQVLFNCIFPLIVQIVSMKTNEPDLFTALTQQVLKASLFNDVSGHNVLENLMSLCAVFCLTLQMSSTDCAFADIIAACTLSL